VLRTEINRVRKAADDLRDRYRAQYNNAALQGSTAPRNNTVEHQVPQNGPHNVAVDNDVAARDEDVAFQEAHTTIINGRHHRPLR
jgi:hypothetical protein